MSQDLLLTLRERVRRIEQSPAAAHGVLPFGVAAIDRALPGGGLARGALHEILSAGGDEEDGALAAAFTAGIVARLTSAEGGIVLWCLARPDLYGLGVAVHGLDPARLVIVRAARDAELLWAMEEGLRTSGVAAVVGEVGTLPDVASRRLQLATERSGITAFVLRRWCSSEQAARERNLPNAATTRWRIAALPSQPIAIRPFAGGFPPSAPLVIRYPVRLQPTGLSRGESAVLDRRAFQTRSKTVMPGVVPGIHVLQSIHPGSATGVDSRDKPGGHDVRKLLPYAPLQSKQFPQTAPRGGAAKFQIEEPGIGHPRWRVELLRCRGGMPACWTAEVQEGQVADATDTLPLAEALADRTQAQVGGDVRPPERIRRTG